MPADLSPRTGGSSIEIRDMNEISNPVNARWMEVIMKEAARERSRFILKGIG